MCGIAGIVLLKKRPLRPEEDGALLRLMGERIAYRGPDDEQVHIDGNVGLIFRRLSIIDTAGGRQPISSDDGAIVHMTNGEIYNHRELAATLFPDRVFRSRSDCEVLTPLYERFGRDYLTHLNGMFATALLDKRRHRLILARDRLGVKPLYYYQSPDVLVFASEIKALLAHPAVPKEFDWHSALTWSLIERYPWASRSLPSFFRDIHYLPGGHFLDVDLDAGTIAQRCYWDPATASPSRSRSADDYIEEYRAILEDAVRAHLLSDVEFGLFLSGGIDSVAVARLASKFASPFHTFTVLSQSTATNGDAPSAHAAARLCGLPNHQVYFDWRELRLTPDEWKRILWTCETHRTGAEQLYKYYLHAYAKSLRPDLKVMLLGQGSDEFNGGYSRSRASRDPACGDQPSWANFENVLRADLRDGLVHKAGAFNDYTDLLPASLLAQFGVNDRPHGTVISLPYLASWAAETIPSSPFEIYRSTYRNTMQVYQLWHEDRTAAAHSIENRVPFLDYRLVEQTYRVPPSLHAELFWDKKILRQAMKGELPESLWQRPKVPFFYGEDLRYTNRMIYRMLQANDWALVEEALVGSSQCGDVINATELRRVLSEMPNDPDYSGLGPVLELVNMGLLSGMARLPAAPSPSSRIPVCEVEISDWGDWQRRSGTKMSTRIDGLSPSSILRFAEGILLVRCDGGDPKWSDPGSYYVIQGHTIRFVIDARFVDWLQFLRQVDGKRTIAAILGEISVRKETIWKQLEEAVEQQVLACSAEPIR